MWVELGIPRPNVAVHDVGVPIRTFINTDHIVRVEFSIENNVDVATVITVKPGGSDKSIYRGDDAKRLKLVMENQKQIWQPLLDYEIEAIKMRMEQEKQNKALQAIADKQKKVIKKSKKK